MGSNLTEGMDTGRVREIAGALSTQAGRIGETAATGTAQQAVLAENWLGTDSEQFGEAWTQAAKALTTAQDALVAYSKTATQQADQQDAASGN